MITVNTTTMNDFEDDEIFRNNVIGTKKDTFVPDQYINYFSDVLDKLEQETGKLYSLSIQEIGCHHPMTLKSFDERSKYVVSDMKSKYKELEGEYSCVIDIKKRIINLLYGDLLVDPSNLTWHLSINNPMDGFISGKWQCPECGYPSNYVGNELCQARVQNICRYIHKSIWYDVKICVKNQEVYQCGGGSLSICHPLGKITCFNK